MKEIHIHTCIKESKEPMLRVLAACSNSRSTAADRAKIARDTSPELSIPPLVLDWSEIRFESPFGETSPFKYPDRLDEESESGDMCSLLFRDG